MDDLGDAVREEPEFFRYVEGPKHDVAARSESSSHRNIPSKSKMLVVSARFGCAFVALRDSISVYDLSSVRKEEPAKAKARVTLPNSAFAVAIELVRADEYLVIQTQNASGTNASNLLLLDARHLICGRLTQVDFLPSNRGAYRFFTTFPSRAIHSGIAQKHDQNADLLVAFTWQRQIEMYSIANSSGTMLWSSNIEVPENQAPISAAFSIDGTMLGVGTMRGSVQFYNSMTGSEGNTIKEVESGWIPVSLSFLAEDSLLVCYKNDLQMQLHHIVWHVKNYAITAHSVLGQLLYGAPDFSDSESGENEVAMLCEPVVSWAICPLANSISSEFTIVARRDDGTWAEWDLDEGKRGTLPLPTGNADFDPVPLGMAIDYTDTSRIESLLANEPLRNPMPRLLVLTSDEVLLSFLLVDDRPGAKCEAVTDVVPETIDRAPSPQCTPAMESASHFKLQHPVAVKPLGAKPPAVFPAKHDVPAKSAPVFTIQTTPPETARAEPKKQDIFEGSSFQPVTSSKEFLDTFSFPDSQVEGTQTGPDAVRQPISQALATANGISDSSITRSESVRQSVVPDISMSIAAAEDDDPVEQVRSILLEMQQELMSASSIGKNTSASVQSVRQEIESKLSEAQVHLSSLLDIARKCFSDQSATRGEVNQTLQDIIENGHNFEDLSLLATLLTDQNDSRPLPREIIQVDKNLSRKESEILSSLSRIEDKLDEPTANGRTGATQQKWRSHAEVIQHIYSSLSLQSIRIKRLRTVLNLFSKQIEKSSLSRNEQRVADLGLSLPRLERLSIRASNSLFVAPQASPKGNKKLSEVDSPFENRQSKALEQLTEKEEPQCSVLAAENASVLRRLAMRKGRKKIVVSPLAPVSNNLSRSRRTAALIRQPIESSAVPGVSLPRAPNSVDAGAMSGQNNFNVTAAASTIEGFSLSNAVGFVHIGGSEASLDQGNSHLPAGKCLPPKRALDSPSFLFTTEPKNAAPTPNKSSWHSERQSVLENKPEEEKLFFPPANETSGVMTSLSAEIRKRRSQSTSGSSDTEAETSRTNVDSTLAKGHPSKFVVSETDKDVISNSSENPIVQIASLPPEPSAHEDIMSTSVAAEANQQQISFPSRSKNVAQSKGKSMPQVASFPTSSSAFGGIGEADTDVADSKADLGPLDETRVLGEVSKEASGAIPEGRDQLPDTAKERSTETGDNVEPSVGGEGVSETTFVANGKTADILSTGSLFSALPSTPNREPGKDEAAPAKTDTATFETLLPGSVAKTESGASQSNPLFAALPPDPDEAGTEVDALHPVSSTVSEPRKNDSLFAALPPDPDDEVESEFNSSTVLPKKPEVHRPSSASGVPQAVLGSESFRRREMKDSDSSTDDEGKENSGVLFKPTNFGHGGTSIFGNPGQTGQNISGSSQSSGLFGSFGSASHSMFSSQVQSSSGFGGATASLWNTSSSMQTGSLFGRSGVTSFGQSSAFATPSNEQRNSSAASPFATFGGAQCQSAMASTIMQNTPAISGGSFLSAPSAAFGTPSKLGVASTLGAPSTLDTSPTFGAPSAIGGSASPPMFGVSQGQSAHLFGSQSSTGSGFTALAQSASGFEFGSGHSQGFRGQGGPSPFSQIASGPSGFGASTQGQSGFGGSQPSAFAALANDGGTFGQSSQSESKEFKTNAFTQRRM